MLPLANTLADLGEMNMRLEKKELPLLTRHPGWRSILVTGICCRRGYTQTGAPKYADRQSAYPYRRAVIC
jgi:hypothetical protein